MPNQPRHWSTLSRRRFVQSAGAAGLGLLAGCVRLPGQAPPRTYRIGYLALSRTPDSAASNLAAFRDGLAQLGYVEGRDVIIEVRASENAAELAVLAADLAALPVDVILTGGEPAAHPARKATSTIPIVMVYPADPVADGLVASLARPGGNVTGVTYFAEQLGPKRMELLKEALPGLSRVAVPIESHLDSVARSIQGQRSAAEALGLELLLLPVREAADIDAAFDLAASERADAVLLGGAALFAVHRVRVVAAAARSKLPTMYWATEFVEAGGLMAYAANIPAQFRRAAAMADKILKGARPADLPVEQPTTFDLTINLKTAQALGLTIPQRVLLQATELIQ